MPDFLHPERSYIQDFGRELHKSDRPRRFDAERDLRPEFWSNLETYFRVERNDDKEEEAADILALVMMVAPYRLKDFSLSTEERQTLDDYLQEYKVDNALAYSLATLDVKILKPERSLKVSDEIWEESPIFDKELDWQYDTRYIVNYCVDHIIALSLLNPDRAQEIRATLREHIPMVQRIEELKSEHTMSVAGMVGITLAFRLVFPEYRDELQLSEAMWREVHSSLGVLSEYRSTRFSFERRLLKYLAMMAADKVEYNDTQGLVLTYVNSTLDDRGGLRSSPPVIRYY